MLVFKRKYYNAKNEKILMRRVSGRFSTTAIRVGLLSENDSSAAASFRSQLQTSSPIFSGLTSDISGFYKRMCPSREQIEDKNTFLNRLQRTVEPVIPDSIVAPYGSAVNGFWTPNSDIDVCIQAPGCRNRGSQIQALRKIASALHPISTHYIEPRFGARIPIIRWAPRREGYLACDISINNSLAVVNSQLIGAYCSADPRVGQLGMTIKHWAAARGINDRSRGTLSSFSLLLMLINFLQKRTPPILLSLQDFALELNEPLVYCQGADVRFVSDKARINAEMDRINRGTPNEESVGELLHGFFRYYGFEYKSGVIAVRDLRGFTRDDEATAYLVVDNPFEVGKDVANVTPSQFTRIRQEFRRAKSLTDAGAPLSEIFAPVSLKTSRDGSHPLDPPQQVLGRAIPLTNRYHS